MVQRKVTQKLLAYLMNNRFPKKTPSDRYYFPKKTPFK